MDAALELRMGADFADVFEVRGFRRARRGRLLAARGRRRSPDLRLRRPRRAALSHGGDDEPGADAARRAGARWELRLLPGESTMLEVVIEPRRGDDDGGVAAMSFGERRQRLRRSTGPSWRGDAHPLGNVSSTTRCAPDLEDLDSLRLSIARDDGAGRPSAFSAPASPGSRRRSAATRS